MESTPPQPIGSGQRMLAAIVFTDTVNFSARMQAEEVVTLDLLKRDFAVMRKYCEQYSGMVLKTTGDGLLLSFSSAVHAVTCAQKIQRYFAETAKTQSEEETLTHRVGIHLGDVFFNENDVMGDGVNIAARLQSEAEPGGICISQTVYDVVMNKMKLEVVKLSARELKNISQVIPMYSVVLKPQKLRPRLDQVSPAAPAPTPAAAVPMAVSKGQKLAIVVGVVIVLGLAARWAIEANSEHNEEMAKSDVAKIAFVAAVGKNAAASDTKTTSLPASGAETTPSTSEKYDFAKMTRDQAPARTGLTDEEALVQQHANESVQVLLTWMDAAMPRYTKDRPLLVREFPPGAISSQTAIFSGPDRKLFFAEGGAIRQRKWTELKPTMLGAVIMSVLLDAQTHPSREVIRGAEAFAYLYGMPPLIEAIKKGDLGAGKPR